MDGFGSSEPRFCRSLGERRRVGLLDVLGPSVSLSFVFVMGSCSPAVITEDTGACLLDTGLACSLDLVGYSCTGSARPDDNPSLSKGIQGIVCDDQGPLPGVGEGFCCTPKTTTCAFDTSAVCPALTSGYSCLGPNRPDSFDPTLSCGQGVPTNGLVVYCCGSMTTAGCAKDTNVQCGAGTTGFACPNLDAGLPTQGDLGTDESRSDALLLCSVPMPSTFQAGFVDYCCYTPTAVPTGATCLQDQSVPGCAAGSWGFACLGPDIPPEDYPRIVCSGTGVRGVNQTGISALLYCCDYEQTD
jgi:hypothetical protein